MIFLYSIKIQNFICFHFHSRCSIEEDSILENDPTDDVPNKVSQDEESERSNDDSDSNPDAEHIKSMEFLGSFL